MTDSVFRFSPVIISNFDKNVQKKFLAQHRLYSEYERSGLKYNVFVQECIVQDKINKKDLENYLFEDLLYGNQRQIFMYEIYSINKNIEEQEELLKLIQQSYSLVDNLRYNQILYQPYNEDVLDLVGIKVSTRINSTKVSKINLIFSERCTIVNRQGQHDEYSYITIEIDLVKKLLFVKVKPKSGNKEEKQKPTALAKKYFNKVLQLLGLTVQDYLNIHKTTLCNMNIDLYKQIYNKMVQTKPENIDEFIKSTADRIKQKINISNYEIKVAENNIFNVHDALQKMIEHILISNILFESTNDSDSDDVDGFVTYIKFSDGTNISARLRSEAYVDPIFSSEAFMALRSSIENTKQISILKIYWLNQFHGLRVSYNAIDEQCLEVLLYKHHEKDEFNHVISKYRECEKNTRQQIVGVLQMEA